MERHRKKRGSLVFLFNRAESELITSQFGDPRCVRPSVRPSVRTRGNIFRLYRPIPSGFTAFRSISRPTGRSVDQRLSLLSTEPIDHKSGIGVRRPFPLPHPQFVFGFGRRPACLKAANMIERLSVQAEEGGRTQNACQRRIGY